MNQKIKTVMCSGALLVGLATFSFYPHTVTYDLSDGVVLNQEQLTTTTKFIKKIELPKEVEKDYYDFVGWQDENNEIITELNHVYKNTQLTAIFEPKTYTINYYDGDTLIDTSEYQYTIGAVELLNSGNTENHPYETFVGWVDEKGNEVDSISTNAHENIDLYASYIGNTYSITYETNKGTLASDVPNEYTYGIGLQELPTPSLKGYTFKGWYKDENFTSDKVTSISTQEHDDITLYAKYEKVTVTASTVSNNNNNNNTATQGQWSCGLGSIGAIKIGSYQAKLNLVDYWGSSLDYMQSVVDASNSCMYSYINNITYIADHASQGFSQTLYNDTLQIMWSDGSVTTYHKRATYYTGTDGYTESGHIFDIESGICTQVCANGGYVYCLWS